MRLFLYILLILLMSSVASYFLRSIPSCCKNLNIFKSKSLHQYNNINNNEKDSTSTSHIVDLPEQPIESDFKKLATSIALISGTTIGAGILALASVSQVYII